MAVSTPSSTAAVVGAVAPVRVVVAPGCLLAAACLVAVPAAVAAGSAEETPTWGAPVTVGAVVAAAALTWRVGRQVRPWAAVMAAAVAGLGAVAGAHGEGWWAVTLAGAGLGVAAVVDVLERRVPTPVAHGTTAVSVASLVVVAVTSGRWGDLGVAAAATGFVVVVYGGLWFAGAVGFGDVRLAAATVTAGVGGIAYVSAMLLVPAVAVGLAGLAQVVARRRVGSVPMGPALVAGWLVAVGSLP